MATPDGSKSNPYEKDPQAVLDFVWDWTAWLAGSGNDSINTTTVTTNDVALAVVGTPQIVGGKVVAFLTGGVLGTKYEATCHITTNSAPTPRQDDRTMYIKIVAK